MPSRLQIQSDIAQPTLRPVASPVDVGFVPVQRQPVPQTLLDFSGLSESISKAVLSLSHRSADRKEADEAASAAAASVRGTESKIAGALASGALPEQANPLQYPAAQRNDALRRISLWSAELGAALEAEGVPRRDASGLVIQGKSFDEIVAEVSSKHSLSQVLSTTGYLPTVRGLGAEMVQSELAKHEAAYTASVADATTEHNKEDYRAQIGGLTTALMLTDTGSPEADAKVEQVSGALAQVVRESTKLFNDARGQAVSTFIETLDNLGAGSAERALEVLGTIEEIDLGGPLGKLGQDARYAPQLVELRASLEARAVAQAEQDNHNKRAGREAAQLQFQVDFLAALANSDSDPVSAARDFTREAKANNTYGEFTQLVLLDADNDLAHFQESSQLYDPAVKGVIYEALARGDTQSARRAMEQFKGAVSSSDLLTFGDMILKAEDNKPYTTSNGVFTDALQTFEGLVSVPYLSPSDALSPEVQASQEEGLLSLRGELEAVVNAARQEATAAGNANPLGLVNQRLQEFADGKKKQLSAERLSRSKAREEAVQSIPLSIRAGGDPNATINKYYQAGAITLNEKLGYERQAYEQNRTDPLLSTEQVRLSKQALFTSIDELTSELENGGSIGGELRAQYAGEFDNRMRAAFTDLVKLPVEQREQSLSKIADETRMALQEEIGVRAKELSARRKAAPAAGIISAIERRTVSSALISQAISSPESPRVSLFVSQALPEFASFHKQAERIYREPDAARREDLLNSFRSNVRESAIRTAEVGGDSSALRLEAAHLVGLSYNDVLAGELPALDIRKEHSKNTSRLLQIEKLLPNASDISLGGQFGEGLSEKGRLEKEQNLLVSRTKALQAVSEPVPLDISAINPYGTSFFADKAEFIEVTSNEKTLFKLLETLGVPTDDSSVSDWASVQQNLLELNGGW